MSLFSFAADPSDGHRMVSPFIANENRAGIQEVEGSVNATNSQLASQIFSSQSEQDHDDKSLDSWSFSFPGSFDEYFSEDLEGREGSEEGSLVSISSQEYSEAGSTETVQSESVMPHNDPFEDDDEFSGLLSRVQALEIQYSSWMEIINDYDNLPKNIFVILEYCNVNHDNFLKALSLSHILSPKQFGLVENFLKQSDAPLKLANNVIPLIANVTRICIINNIKKDLEDLEDGYHQLKSKIHTEAASSQSEKRSPESMVYVQQGIHQLNQKLLKDQQEFSTKNSLKIWKILSLASKTPLEKLATLPSKTATKLGKIGFNIYKNISGMQSLSISYRQQKEWIHLLKTRFIVNINCPTQESQETLKEDFRKFLNSLKDSGNLKEINEKLLRAGITVKIPLSFENWEELFGQWEELFSPQHIKNEQLVKSEYFLRQLRDLYYYYAGKQLVINQDQIKSLLRQRQIEKKQRIDKSVSFILNHIHHCQQLDFPNIKAYFKNLHIQIDQIDSSIFSSPAPNSKEEWEQCVQDPTFCQALAKQWVDDQEILAQLSAQAFQQALLSKNSVEEKFLRFRGLEYTVSMITSLTQFIFCLPRTSLSPMTPIIELLVADITKLDIPGLGLIQVVYPVYSDLNLKIDNLFMKVIEHCFAIRYKPNEYSLEGYEIVIKARLFGFIVKIHYLRSLLEQVLLWLNIKVIENLISRKNKPEDEDERYAKISQRYEQERLNCKKQIEELEERLDKLRVEDAKLHVCSPEGSLNQQRELTTNPIQILAQSFMSAKFEYFPSEFHRFFEENFGFKLTEANKAGLEKKLEEFFSKTEEEFVDSYQEHRFDHLKV